MYISSFFRVKIYKREGRNALILRITLPKACDIHIDDEDKYKSFNSFYSSLADAYFAAGERFLNKIENGERTVVSVNFSLLENCSFKRRSYNSERYICVSRSAFSNSAKVVNEVKTDIYDKQLGIFIK